MNICLQYVRVLCYIISHAIRFWDVFREVRPFADYGRPRIFLNVSSNSARLPAWNPSGLMSFIGYFDMIHSFRLFWFGCSSGLCCSTFRLHGLWPISTVTTLPSWVLSMAARRKAKESARCAEYKGSAYS